MVNGLNRTNSLSLIHFIPKTECTRDKAPDSLHGFLFSQQLGIWVVRGVSRAAPEEKAERI